MEWWQTILLTLVTLAVPSLIAYFLNRRGANKKLVIEETASDVSVFDMQTKVYQDLLDRANNTIKELDGYNAERTELISTVRELKKQVGALEEADESKTRELSDTNDKLERLRTLFSGYIARVGTVPLTTDEMAIFEDTIPTRVIRQKRRGA